jgi:hypothetical protein
MTTDARAQDALRDAPRTWNTKYGIQLGKVIEVFPEHGTCHLAMSYGNIVRHALVLSGFGGTREGVQSLPQVIDNDPKPDREGTSIIDEYTPSDKRDTYAVVAYVDGAVHRPVCWIMPPNFWQGSFPETNLSIDRHAGDAYIARYAVDNPNPDDIRAKVKKGDGTFDDEDKPAPEEYPRKMSWEQVFPDNRRLAKADDALQKHPPGFEPYDAQGGVSSGSGDTASADTSSADTSSGGRSDGSGGGGNGTGTESLYRLGLETYQAVGYGYQGEMDKVLSHKDVKVEDLQFTSAAQFPEPPLSATPSTYPDGLPQITRRALGHSEKGKLNFDNDLFPWRRHRENQARFARGMRFNQRWGTYVELTRGGDIRLLAEGMNKNVYPELDDDAKAEADKSQADQDAVATLLYQNPDWGNLYLMARSETRGTDKGAWAFHRKRFKAGGRLEGFDTTVDKDKEDDGADVRRWGQSRIRTQRTFQAISRKDLDLRSRDSLSLLAGHVDDGDVDAETAWSRSDPKDGGDFPRYQDRLKWRNTDSDESANILIQSVRGKLSEFGPDKPTRDKDTGGTIKIITSPEEGDNAVISLQAMAAKDKAEIDLIADAGVKDQTGEGAKISLSASSRVGTTVFTVSDSGGVASSHVGGNGASMDVSARSDGDNATATLIADTLGDNALVDIEAKTEQGKNATVQVWALPAGGLASLDFKADSPENSEARLSSGSSVNALTRVDSTGTVDIESTGENLKLTAAQVLQVLSHQDMTFEAFRSITQSADTITLQGSVNIVGTLMVNGRAVTVP